MCWILGHAFRFEADVAELLDQGLEWHAVLEAERNEGADGVHQAVNRGAGLRHLNEDFAGLAVLEFTDGDITFGAAERELVCERLAGVGQLAADTAR